uniref:Uncharacterized protein n=1 Tax=Arundo donax TaxID=35708 RepID=A0A0A8YU77_ARUDO
MEKRLEHSAGVIQSHKQISLQNRQKMIKRTQSYRPLSRSLC